MRTAFDPTVHGVGFANDFVNVVDLPVVPTIRTTGRCGGIAAFELDCFESAIAVTRNQTPPPDGTLLGDLMLRRLYESWAKTTSRWFAEYTLWPSKRTWVVPGLVDHCRSAQFPRLQPLLDAGRPQVIGVIRSMSIATIGVNHQVVAHGYEVEGDEQRILVSDSNHPDVEVVVSSRPGAAELTASVGSGWRGWFVHDHNVKPPWFLADGSLLRDAGTTAVVVVRGGAAFALAGPADVVAIGLAGTPIRDVPARSFEWFAPLGPDNTVLREVGAERYALVRDRVLHEVSVPQVRELPDRSVLELDGQHLAITTVPQGSLDGRPWGSSV